MESITVGNPVSYKQSRTNADKADFYDLPPRLLRSALRRNKSKGIVLTNRTALDSIVGNIYDSGSI